MMNSLIYKVTSLQGLCILKIHITNKRINIKKELNVLKKRINTFGSFNLQCEICQF